MSGKVTAAVIDAIRSMTPLAQIYVRIASVRLARVVRGAEGFDGQVRFDVHGFGCKGRLIASVSRLVCNGVGRPFCIYYSIIIFIIITYGGSEFLKCGD